MGDSERLRTPRLEGRREREHYLLEIINSVLKVRIVETKPFK